MNLQNQFEFYKELLSEGQDICFEPQGISMRPFLSQGRSKIIVTRLKSNPKKNDILLYLRDGCLVSHRVHKVLKDGSLVMLGDGNVVPEPPMPLEYVLGVVTEIETDGRRYSVRNPLYRFVTTVWNNTLFLRKILFRIKNKRFIYHNYLPKDCADTVALVRSVICGESLPNGFSTNCSKLLPMIWANRFESLVAPVIFENPDIFFLSDNQRKQLDDYFFYQNVCQYNLYNELDRIFAYAEEKGIKIALLKGLVLAGCYPNPSARYSDDADIYAPGDAFDCISEYFLKNGYKSVDSGQPCTVSFLLGDSIHIELHEKITLNTTLRGYEAMRNSGLFSPDSFIRLEVDDHRIMTVEHTNHLIYMVYHFAKHFIMSNSEGRMLTDIALFVNKYYDEIDFDKVHKTLISCGLDKFCDAVFSLCVNFFSMNPDALNKSDRNVFSQKQLQKMLKIILEAVMKTDIKQMEKLAIFFHNKVGRYPKTHFPVRLLLSMLAQSWLIVQQNRLCRQWNILN